jgi:hypothetical protein
MVTRLQFHSAQPSTTVFHHREVLMRHFRFPSPSLAVATAALFLAIGGGYAAASNWSGSQNNVRQMIGHSTANNARHLGGISARSYLLAKHFVTSGGDHFLTVGQTVMLGRAGHFTFSASCTNPSGTMGGQQVTFDVTANTVAGLDGNPPQAAGKLQNIHTNSDAMDSTTATPLNAGDFDQVGSASSSTEIAADGQEVDVFYNDGVNWPAMNGSPAHDCFAGFTGFLG